MQSEPKTTLPPNSLWVSVYESFLRGWRWLIVPPILGVLSIFCYERIVPEQYMVKGVLELRHNALNEQLKSSGLTPAEFKQRAIAGILSPKVIATALLRMDGSQFDLTKTTDNPAQFIKSHLNIDIDVAGDQIGISLKSPFRHHAADVVNSVLESLLVTYTSPHSSSTQDATLIIPSASQLRPATADVPAVGMPYEWSAIISGGLGMIFGSSVALYRGLVYGGIYSPRQIERYLRVRSAGYLPRMSSKLSPAGRTLLAHMNPSSEVAMQCRSSLLQILGGNENDQGRAILVTSPSHGEGRSTVAMNLAATLALMGEAVVLIDASMQSPILHKLFGQADSSLGLFEALDNPSSARDFVRQTHIRGLDFVSCGKASSASTAKLQGDSLGRVLLSLSENYKYLIFDGGPLLGNPDTLAISLKCDATLLVCHADRTPITVASNAARLLKQYGARRLFAIVNELPAYLGRQFFQGQPIGNRTLRPVSDFDDIHDYGLVMP